MPDAEVLLEHAEFLRRLARGILHDADAADDVAQDALLEAMRGRPRNPRGWLGKVAVRLALTRRRAESRRAERERAAARPEALPSAAEGVARLELQRRLVDAVLALEEPYRSVVVHRFFYDVTPTEIARRLRVPLETVRTRLRRALGMLRARLDASHGREAWSVALLALAAPRKLPLGGLFAMSLKTKLVAASILVLACALGMSMLSRPEPPSPRAEAPRHEARVPEPEAVASPAPPPIDFAAIDRDRDVHGIVVDPAGNAVPNADVRVVRYPYMGVGIGLATLETEEGPGTRTASDGSFALRVERGEEVDLRVKAVGFVELQRRWCPAGGKVRIVMRKGVSLRVRAADPDGRPLAGTHVIVFKGKEPEMEAAGIYYVYILGMTDERGECVFGDLLPRDVQLTAWHAHHGFDKPRSVRLPEAGEADVRFEAERGRDLEGRVTDAATGAPVAGAVVNAYPMVLPFAKSVSTDADGRYRYGAWERESKLHVHAEGYAVGRAVVGDQERIDVALRKGSTVTGVVRDARGAAIAGAFVGLVTRDYSEIRETRSDAQGRFELRDVGSQRSVLVASKPGFARAQAPVERPEVDVVLPDPCRLEGRVLGPDGEPLAAVVRAESNSLEVGENYERHSDDLGRFRFPDLRSGSWVVSVTASDERRTSREVKIEGRDVLDFDIQYERGREFTVLVVDEAGRPVKGVGLTCSSGRKATGDDGRATIEMPRGSDVDQVFVSKLAASSTDRRFVRPPATNYRLGQGELRIVLRDAVTLSGRVLLDGEPLPGAALLLTGPDFHEATGTDKDGSFSRSIPARAEVKIALNGQFERLAAGVERETEFRPIYGEATVAPGTTEVVLHARRVPLDRTIVVRVTGPDGTGVEGIQLSYDARGFRAEKAPVTDANGRVELAGLPAGEVSVGLGIARAPAPWAMPKSAHATFVPEGQEVVFAFRAATPIRGVVLMPDGTPAKANVVAWRGQDFVASASGADDGTFAIYIPADEPEPVRLEAFAGKAKGEIVGVSPGAEGVAIQLAP